MHYNKHHYTIEQITIDIPFESKALGVWLGLSDGKAKGVEQGLSEGDTLGDKLGDWLGRQCREAGINWTNTKT